MTETDGIIYTNIPFDPCRVVETEEGFDRDGKACCTIKIPPGVSYNDFINNTVVTFDLTVKPGNGLSDEHMETIKKEFIDDLKKNARAEIVPQYYPSDNPLVNELMATLKRPLSQPLTRKERQEIRKETEKKVRKDFENELVKIQSGLERYKEIIYALYQRLHIIHTQRLPRTGPYQPDTHMRDNLPSLYSTYGGFINSEYSLKKIMNEVIRYYDSIPVLDTYMDEIEDEQINIYRNIFLGRESFYYHNTAYYVPQVIDTYHRDYPEQIQTERDKRFFSEYKKLADDVKGMHEKSGRVELFQASILDKLTIFAEMIDEIQTHLKK